MICVDLQQGLINHFFVLIKKKVNHKEFTYLTLGYCINNIKK